MPSPSLRDAGPVRVISDSAYSWGSNFFPCAIPHKFTHPDGKPRVVVFRSSEHFYMWHKNEEPIFRSAILKAKTAFEAKKIGSQAGMRQLGVRLVPEWDVGQPPYKVMVMRKVVAAKFVTNPVLAELLVRTGYREIIEDAPWDEFWGTGKQGQGQNMLGKTLMYTRHMLQQRLLRPYVFELDRIMQDMHHG